MTADELVTAVSLRAALPTFQYTYKPLDILSVADSEMRGYVYPALLEAQEDFGLDYDDILLVANQATYTIPSRAMGGSVRKLAYLDTSVSPAVEHEPLVRVSVDDLGKLLTTSMGSYPPGFFYFSDASFTVVPTPPSNVSGYIRCYYLRQPSKLISQGLGGILGSGYGVSQIVGVTGQSVALSSFMSASSTGILLDIIRGANPHGLIGKSISGVTNENSTPLVFPAGYDLSQVTPNVDYMAVAGYTPVPLCPDAWHEVLALRTAGRVLRSLGDKTASDDCFTDADRMRATLLNIAQPRSPGNKQKFSAWRG